MNNNTRKLPNILITGTPCTGKTTTAKQVCSELEYNHINISELVKEKEFYTEYDEEYETFVIDEDPLLDSLEDQMAKGGNIVDYHGCDFFPERWFDFVIVLRTDNQFLYKRLEKRNYNEKKFKDNLEAEIMQVILDEAYDSYKEEIITVLKSDTIEQLEENVVKIIDLIKHWNQKENEKEQDEEF
ncbi:pos9-activating factor fap7-related [Anaeramoeba flamelloides]|uniref:Adenylate kinase isoenzyme 6 homolog n=1 Tax=Anaeramoeba flamelloides TaxID=1746091 RepID=A0ABQ8YEE2_9EUKA|nr:pos9-activating factor fap7-related [Anaeramoeba flamelloides]